MKNWQKIPDVEEFIDHAYSRWTGRRDKKTLKYAPFPGKYPTRIALAGRTPKTGVVEEYIGKPNTDIITYFMRAQERGKFFYLTMMEFDSIGQLVCYKTANGVGGRPTKVYDYSSLFPIYHPLVYNTEMMFGQLQGRFKVWTTNVMLDPIQLKTVKRTFYLPLDAAIPLAKEWVSHIAAVNASYPLENKHDVRVEPKKETVPTTTGFVW